MELVPDSQSAHLIDIARQLVKLLPDEGLRAAFLFGSAAWGDADASSDLDIMLLLDRPADYREVTRVHLADLFGHPLSNGPVFADIDRISVEAFVRQIRAGNWSARVVNSVILKDTDDFYASLRAQMNAAFLQLSARKERFLARCKQAEGSRSAALEALETDVLLSALHARLALQHAGSALIELNGNRVSPSHFVESLERAMDRFSIHLFAPCLAALSLDAPYEAVKRSLLAFDVFIDAIQREVEDASVSSCLSQEDLAWAGHIIGKQEEITHKVAAFTQEKRLPALLYYLDGLFQVPICIQVGEIFQIRASGKVERMALPAFQVALRQKPVLYDEWIAALRLSAERVRVLEVIDLSSQLLNRGRAALEIDEQI